MATERDVFIQQNAIEAQPMRDDRVTSDIVILPLEHCFAVDLTSLHNMYVLTFSLG